ncbi:hypothetical protein [Kiloniella sp. b19]|uniref:hypothetical protein n=1 Tax=Kiloniella sp. GXU_MW_B19 TaxID=3141326 RepID=UPI0031DCF793
MVFPLIQSANTLVEIGKWQDFVDLQIQMDAESGIIAARASNGIYVGLACYRAFSDVKHEKVLEVSHFASAGLTRTGEIAVSILTNLEKEAKRLGCKAVHICFDTPVSESSAQSEQTVANSLKGCGYEQDAVRLCKTL